MVYYELIMVSIRDLIIFVHMLSRTMYVATYNPCKTRPFEKLSASTQRNEKEKITVDDSNRLDRMEKILARFGNRLLRKKTKKIQKS